MRKGKVALATIALALVAGALSSCTYGARCTQCFLRNAKFLYTIGNNIAAFTVDANTGRLTAVPGSPFPVSVECPRLAVADPAGKFLYVPNTCGSEVAGFSIDPTTGSLTPISGSPFLITGGSNRQQAVISPDGKFFYISDSIGLIFGKQIAADGSFAQNIPGSPVAANQNPIGLVAHPTGKFLYASNVFPGGTITAFSIDPTSGALTEISGSPFPISGQDDPKFMAIHPSGRFLYATSPNLNHVLAFSIDLTSGALSPLAGSPFTTGPNPEGIDAGANGKFLFVANPDEGAGNVSAYLTDASTGALTPAPNSPFLADGDPIAVAAEASCRFLFVANSSSNDVTVFAIDPNTAALTQISGSPFPTNARPQGLVVIER